MSEKRFMVVSTHHKHEIFQNACDYLNVDIHDALNAAMKDISVAALQQMETEGIDTDDAQKELLSAYTLLPLMLRSHILGSCLHMGD